LPLPPLRRALVVLAVLTWAAPAAAQQDHQTTDARFAPIHLPTPNVYRTASGRPGPQYWQQRVDYDIRATLDPTKHQINGTETITYANHSPDTLSFVWLQLDQNLFRPGSEGAQVFSRDRRFGGAIPGGGFDISKVASGGTALNHRIVDTVMRVDLSRPLPPGGTTTLSLDWSFLVPEHGADRMGRDGDHYVVAQWYPRLAVYDDVRGWNTLPYLGQGEFYLEYGSFDVELTVPAPYLVGATGSLKNPDAVLTATERERLAQARQGSQVVHVVTRDELDSPSAFRPRTDGTLTWKFRADSVRDFAWMASPRVLWDATSANGGKVLVNALFRPEALPAWGEAAQMTKHAMEFYSNMLIDYPYPTATAVEGPVLGMEYPMVVFVSAESGREDLFDVIDHEWGHSWFPMVVGSDERRYAWMDEGFNTFINQFSKADYFPQSHPFLENVAQYAAASRASVDQPIGTLPDEFEPGGAALGIGAYVKPAVMLNALRAIVGPDAFGDAFSAYARRWAFNHPQPADFFRTMSDELGLDLDTFWNGWINTTATSDVAILGVDQGQAGGMTTVTVTIDMRGALPMPAHVTATTADGDSTSVTIPSIGFYGTDRATATLMLPAKATRITVNAGPEWGDVNPQNNTWTK